MIDLKSLSKDALLDLKKQIGAMLQFAGAGPQAVAAATDQDMVLDCLANVLRSKGVEFVAPVMLKRTVVYASFVKKVPVIMRYLRQATHNRHRLRALTTLGITLLYDDLTRMGLATTSRTLMAHIHRVPAMINQQFPGYAQNGILGMIVGERNLHVRKK